MPSMSIHVPNACFCSGPKTNPSTITFSIYACQRLILLKRELFSADLHLLYGHIILAVWARLQPHGAIHILVSLHEQELNVLATLCALDLTIFADLTMGLRNKHQSRCPLVLN